MYRCEECGKQSKPGEPMSKKYEYRKKSYVQGFEEKTFEGFEIKSEKNVCFSCGGK